MKVLGGHQSRFITGLAVCAGLALMAPQPPMTQAATPSITISPIPVLVDGIARVSGSGFKPKEAVLLRENGTLLSTTIAGAHGKFSRKVTVPTSVVEHPTVVFTAYGSESKVSASSTVSWTTR